MQGTLQESYDSEERMRVSPGEGGEILARKMSTDIGVII